MLKIMLPRDVFLWVEEKRGEQSRAAFIVDCLKQVMVSDNKK